MTDTKKAAPEGGVKNEAKSIDERLLSLELQMSYLLRVNRINECSQGNRDMSLHVAKADIEEKAAATGLKNILQSPELTNGS